MCRFLICVPTCTCQPIAMYAYHPHPSQQQQAKDFNVQFENELLSCTEMLHPLATGSCFNFPERRLIQYDCGMQVQKSVQVLYMYNTLILHAVLL